MLSWNTKAACVEKGEAEELGDFKKGNKLYKTIYSTYLFLCNSNRLFELIPLLDHANPYVRLWASTYALQIDQSKAEQALELLSMLGGNVGFCSSITLREWKHGRLVL